jgi:hypothetical protein
MFALPVTRKISDDFESFGGGVRPCLSRRWGKRQLRNAKQIVHRSKLDSCCGPSALPSCMIGTTSERS